MEPVTTYEHQTLNLSVECDTLKHAIGRTADRLLYNRNIISWKGMSYKWIQFWYCLKCQAQIFLI